MGHERRVGEKKRGRGKRRTKRPREFIGKMDELSKRKEKLEEGKASSWVGEVYGRGGSEKF